MSQSRAETNSLDGRACPEPAVVAAFIDGKLDGRARSEIIEHMDGCDRCYEWISGSLQFLSRHSEDHAENLSSEPSLAQSSGSSKARPGHGERGRTVKPFFKRWPVLASAGVLAAAAALILALNPALFYDPDPDFMVGMGHAQTALVDLAEQGAQLTRFKLPLEIDEKIESKIRRFRGDDVTLSQSEALRQAVAFFEKNLLKNPSDVRARVHLVSLYLQAEDDLHAFQNSQALAGAGGAEARCLSILGKFAYARDKSPMDVAQALQDMRALYRTHPQSATVAFNLGALLHETGGPEDELRAVWSGFLDLEPEGPYANRVRRILEGSKDHKLR